MSVLPLLAGDPQAFVSKVWGTQRHLHHGDREFLAGLLTLDDVDRLLTASALRSPAVRVVQDGTIVPFDRLTRSATIAGMPLTGLLDPTAALRHFDAGATIVLQGLHRYHEPLGDLVAQLELDLGHPCQANAYLTPAASQGFTRHADTHDVFVVQTVGTKRWQLWPTGILDDGVGHGSHHSHDEPDDIVLEPGSCLYLPTGTPHAARAQAGVSLHVTLGINHLTWRSLVDRAVRAAGDRLEPDLDLDAHLPAGYLDDDADLRSGLQARITALAACLTALDAERLTREQSRRFVTNRAPRLRGGLLDRAALPALHDATALRRRPGRPLTVAPDGDRVALLAGDRTVWLPARLRDAAAWIAETDRLTPRDFDPWLDEPGRLVLCRRLVSEGVLEIDR